MMPFSEVPAISFAVMSNINNASSSLDTFTARDVNCSKDDDIGIIMARAGILPIALLGILGNVASFWIWHAETSYSATPLLFKYLALCDSVYLALNFTFVLLLDTPCCRWCQVVVTHCRNFAHILSVHTTLLVAVSRWLAVCRPFRVHRVLTKRHVLQACLGIFFWCLLVEAVEVVRKLGASRYEPKGSRNRALIVLHESLGYLLPSALLLLLSVHLLWTTRRKFHESRVLHESEGGGPGAASAADCSSADVRFRRLTYTVLCVALSSFVAYPLGVIAEMVSLFELSDTCHGHVYWDVLATLGGLLQVINSGVNVLFYWAFVSRFRELLAFRVPCCFREDGGGRGGGGVGRRRYRDGSDNCVSSTEMTSTLHGHRVQLQQDWR